MLTTNPSFTRVTRSAGGHRRLAVAVLLIASILPASAYGAASPLCSALKQFAAEAPSGFRALRGKQVNAGTGAGEHREWECKNVALRECKIYDQIGLARTVFAPIFIEVESRDGTSARTVDDIVACDFVLVSNDGTDAWVPVRDSAKEIRRRYRDDRQALDFEIKGSSGAVLTVHFDFLTERTGYLLRAGRAD